MLHLMSERKAVTLKSLLMVKTIQRNQFFQNVLVNLNLCISIWGEKNMVQVVLLLCLWKNRSWACWGVLDANDRLINLQIRVHTRILFGNTTVILLLNACWLRAGGWNEHWGPISYPRWEGSSLQRWIGDPRLLAESSLKYNSPRNL